jgi:hypothetical protein
MQSHLHRGEINKYWYSSGKKSAYVRFVEKIPAYFIPFHPIFRTGMFGRGATPSRPGMIGFPEEVRKNGVDRPGEEGLPNIIIRKDFRGQTVDNRRFYDTT